MRRLPLRRKGRVVAYALIDNSEYKKFSRWKWKLDTRGYVVRTAWKRTVVLHREIMKTPRHLVVDHVNSNRLDNRKKNLRNCTLAQNMWNRRNKKGCRRMPSGRWEAEVTFNKKILRLGLFDTKKEALAAYNKAAKKHHGKFFKPAK